MKNTKGTINSGLECSEQFVEFWEDLIKELGAKGDEQDGIIIKWADTSFIFCNALIFGDAGIDEVELNKRLLFALDFMRKKKNSGIFLIVEELLTQEARLNFQERIKEVGFSGSEVQYGMSGDISKLEEPFHPDLQFKRISTQEDLNAFGVIHSNAHKSPSSNFTDNFKISKFWTEVAHVFIGFTEAGHKPVCCAAAFPVNGSLYLVGVSTEPEYQRRGYGELITRKVLYEGGKAYGLDRVTFQSTEMALPIYKCMGMKIDCIVHILLYKKT